MIKKIAIITENGTRISSHFGRAPLVKIYTVENGQVLAEEERQKAHFTGDHHHDANHHHHGKGAQMFQTFTDCQVLICGGMGQPALDKAQNAGLEVYLSGGEIETALQQYLRGELISDPRRVHPH